MIILLKAFKCFSVKQTDPTARVLLALAPRAGGRDRPSPRRPDSGSGGSSTCSYGGTGSGRGSGSAWRGERRLQKDIWEYD